LHEQRGQRFGGAVGIGGIIGEQDLVDTSQRGGFGGNGG